MLKKFKIIAAVVFCVAFLSFFNFILSQPVQAEAASNCSLCGQGWLNPCDEKECYSLGDCEFEKNWYDIGGACKNKITVIFSALDAQTEQAILTAAIKVYEGERYIGACVTENKGVCAIPSLLAAREYSVEAVSDGYSSSGKILFIPQKAPSVIIGLKKFIDCVDSDVNNEFPDGKNYYLNGVTKSTQREFTDFCDGNVLNEYYCSGGSAIGKAIYECPEGCEGGVCKKSPVRLIDCQKEYGQGYECNTFDYWQKTCKDTGDFQELGGFTCKEGVATGGIGRTGCFTCRITCSAASVAKDCANLACSDSQKQCINGQCICKDIVVAPESIKIISPKGGDVLEIKKSYTISWEASGLNSTSKFKVQICTDQSTPICISLNSNILLPVTKTSLSIEIPIDIFSLFKGGISTNDRFKIRVSEVLSNGSTGVVAMRDDNFSIVVSIEPQPKCIDIKDCANFTCLEGRPQCADGKCVCEKDSQPQPKCSDVKECANFVCAEGVPQCLDGICACKNIPPTAKSITVVSPKGGETFEIGKTYTTSWQAIGLSPDSKLKVQICTDQSTPICISANDGVLLPITQTSLSPTIPTNIFSLFKGGISTNDRFKIRVSEVLSNGSTGAVAMRDDNFSIVVSVKPQCSTCGQPGIFNGLFNPCDQTECKKISKECIFFDNKCFGKSECQQYCSGQKTKSVCGSNGITYNNKCLAICAGATAVSDDSCKVEIKIPDGALAPGTDARGSIQPLPVASDDFKEKKAALENLGRKVVGRYDVSVRSNGVEIHNFNQPVIITIPYTSEQVRGFDEGGLQIYLFNEQSNQWEALPTTINKKDKVLTAPAPHLTPAAVTAPDDKCGKYCRGEDSSMPAGTACLCSKSNSPKCPVGDPTCTHPLEEGIIDRAINWIFYFGLILAPLFVVIGAFMIMTSGGGFKKSKNAEGIEGIFNPTLAGGRKMIIGAVIGLTLALCTKLIYNLIRFLIGQ